LKIVLTSSMLALVALAAHAAADASLSGSATASFASSNDGATPLNVVSSGGDSASLAFGDGGVTVEHAPSAFALYHGVLAAAGWASDGAQGGGVSVDASFGLAFDASETLP
jgi:hypothetical protein